jgi:hypothetical protein
MMKNTTLHLTPAKTGVQRTPSATARRLSLGAALCATLVLGACASLGNASPEAQITQRANARWQALVTKDVPTAYALSTPSFRSQVDLEAYRDRIGSAVVWEAAEAVAVTCSQPALCKAQIRIDVKPLVGRGAANKFSTYIDETWVLENGQWWFVEPIEPK